MVTRHLTLSGITGKITCLGDYQDKTFIVKSLDSLGWHEIRKDGVLITGLGDHVSVRLYESGIEVGFSQGKETDESFEGKTDTEERADYIVFPASVFKR